MTIEHNRKSHRLNLHPKIEEQPEDHPGKTIVPAHDRVENEINQEADVLKTKTAELERFLAMLRAVIECTADGLLVTDESGKILCHNQLYLDMRPLPPELMKTAHHQAIIQYCRALLKDPQQFESLTERIYATWPQASFDVLELNNGRVFERYTRVKFMEGQKAARVWSFRDITERSQAEAHTA